MQKRRRDCGGYSRGIRWRDRRNEPGVQIAEVVWIHLARRSMAVESEHAGVGCLTVEPAKAVRGEAPGLFGQEKAEPGNAAGVAWVRLHIVEPDESEGEQSSLILHVRTSHRGDLLVGFGDPGAREYGREGTPQVHGRRKRLNLPAWELAE